jgi:hypothetical protein
VTHIRGQLTFLVPQPEVTYATLYENTYMFSRRDGVLLGGTHEMRDLNLEPDMTTKSAILAKQQELVWWDEMARVRLRHRCSRCSHAWRRFDRSG